MKGCSRVVFAAVGLLMGLVAPSAAEAQNCPRDSVRNGTTCIDKYEASVWLIQPGVPGGTLTQAQRQVIDAIRSGNVTRSDLDRVGAVQLGIAFEDLQNNGCPVTAAGCVNVYAVSIAGVQPAAFINWFQAVAAARNSFKRLPTNAEWQAAAFGTPDPGAADNGSTTCNTTTDSQSLTGARSNCVSDVGAFDMVGNVWEWVSDAIPRSVDGQPDSCGSGSAAWPSAFGHDAQCLLGAATAGQPGALARGGEFVNAAASSNLYDGVFAATGLNEPTSSAVEYGFRAVR